MTRIVACSWRALLNLAGSDVLPAVALGEEV
jgi:hypothetical protein